MNEPLINLDAIIYYYFIVIGAVLLIGIAKLTLNKSIAELFKVAGLPFAICLVLSFVIYAPDGTIKSMRNDMEVFTINKNKMINIFGVFGLFLPHEILDNCKTDECEYRTTKYNQMEAI